MYLGIVFLMVSSCFGWAQTIQVPENCLNKVSPCLFRTEDSFFRFQHDEQQVVLMKDGIIKVYFDEKHNNFDLIEGRMSLQVKAKAAKSSSVHNISLDAGQFLISKFSNRLSILNLSHFILKEYSIGTDGVKPSLVRSEFMNKKDFVEFTRYYFTNLQQYKKFLAVQSLKWKHEFELQSTNQTKVLERSIALETLKVATESKIEREKKELEAAQTKKIKDEFFYRTFKR